MSSDTPQPSSSHSWIVFNCVLVLLLIGAGAYFVTTNEEAAEVASAAFWGIFTFFTTPFVLETTLVLFAILAVGVINQRRIDREGDGWVYLPRTDEKPESVEEKSDSAPR